MNCYDCYGCYDYYAAVYIIHMQHVYDMCIYTCICILYIYDVSNNSHAETRIHKCLSWYWRSSDKSMWLYNVNIFISTVERRHVTIHCNSVCFDWISHDLPAVRACKHQLSCTSNSIGCGWEAAAQVPTVKKKRPGSWRCQRIWISRFHQHFAWHF